MNFYTTLKPSKSTTYLECYANRDLGTSQEKVHFILLGNCNSSRRTLLFFFIRYTNSCSKGLCSIYNLNVDLLQC